MQTMLRLFLLVSEQMCRFDTIQMVREWFNQEAVCVGQDAQLFAQQAFSKFTRDIQVISEIATATLTSGHVDLLVFLHLDSSQKL